MQEVGFSVQTIGGVRVLLLNDLGEPIVSDRDADDVMGEIFSNEAQFVAIPTARLTSDVFVLRMGVAGEVIQKFINYGVRVAVLGDITDQVAASDALRDFVRESNRGSHVWFLADLGQPPCQTSYFHYLGTMEIKSAVAALSAIANDGRLAIFRLLVEAGPEGLAAGEIARRLGVLPNTLSANLTILNHADMVSSRREGRSIIYAARYDQMAALLSFLMKDCCGGAPEVCAPLAEVVNRAACCA